MRSQIVIMLFYFNTTLLFFKKLAFDGFYPLLAMFKRIDFCCFKMFVQKKKFWRIEFFEEKFSSENNMQGSRFKR